MLDLYYSTEGVLEQFNQNILLEAVNNVITRVQQIYSTVSGTVKWNID